MDYPVDDPTFRENIEEEAIHQLSRVSPHPSLAVLCGNSEVAQQAAMRGVPRELWSNSWFSERLPELCSEHAPGVLHVPSSPWGGALPFHVNRGIAHYYGVGAYLQSAKEVRKDDVPFASECLAFANVPEPDTVSAIMAAEPPALHHPRWKQRVPRDTGAGWDFDDVRDFYLQQLFSVDPVRLRCFDMTRYLQLSRVVPGEMMTRVFSEWRSGHSRNRGGLVWFFKDLWPAAGWGILDSFGRPKAAYYQLRRAWQTRQIALTDEGLNGLHLHVANETSEVLDGWVELLLLREGHIAVACREVPCKLPPRTCRTLESDELLDGFHDVTHSYRFGPPSHDIAIATLFDNDRRVVSEAFYFVQAREPIFLESVNLEVGAEKVAEDDWLVTLRSDRFLHSVSFDSKGFLAEDNYFHLAPGRTRSVRLSVLGDTNTRFRAQVEALNLKTPIEIRLKGVG
jgi:beta-mannosidase